MKQTVKDIADWYKNHRELLCTKMVAHYIGAGPYCTVARGGDLETAKAASITALAYEREELMHTRATQTQRGALLFLIILDGVQGK